MRQPTLFIPHGGGPCFFMDWHPPQTWVKHRDFLAGLPALLPERPRALLVISAHWECARLTVQCQQAPSLLFDYVGFPPLVTVMPILLAIVIAEKRYGSIAPIIMPMMTFGSRISIAVRPTVCA